MKVAVIGAGNMGGAIAQVLSANRDRLGIEVSVANPTQDKLDAIKAKYPQTETTTSNIDAVKGADYVILAVKPWILPAVVSEIRMHLDYDKVSVISVAGGVSISEIASMLNKEGTTPSIFHVIPTTALSVGKSMTFISSSDAYAWRVDKVKAMFECMGEVAVVQERLMGAATALSSCGIAYVYKYMQACVQAGVQMGFYPHDALDYVLQTMEGAIAMIRSNGTLPQQEIDRVTTPGGMTIKGINMLEQCGFVSAVIKANLEPIK